MAFAIITTGGKQYRVSPGTKLKIEKLDVKADESVTFDKVLLSVDGDNVKIGTPHVSGVAVTAKVLKEGRGKKQIVFKYKQKTRRRTKNTHRQPFTEIEITAVK